MSYEIFVLALASLLLSSALTDWAGVHPLFGAFIAGICFPRIPSWQTATGERTEMLTSALLLPLFFALTGLKTRLDLLSSVNTWLWAILHSRRSHRRQDRGSGICRALVRTKLAKLPGPWGAAQHARPRGARGAKYRLQRRCVLANALHHARAHGLDHHHVHDAVTQLAENSRSTRCHRTS